MKRTGPSVDRANSKQDYATPREFLDAVERQFGSILWDLAANAANKVCGNHYGPGSTWGDDSFAQDWADTYHACTGATVPRLLWLNPEYNAIPRWAQRCAEARDAGARIAFLVPASVGANWYWDHVAPYSRVLSVGRILFVVRCTESELTAQQRPYAKPAGDLWEAPACFDAKGKPTPYSKDLILALYDRNVLPAFERWKWKRRAV